jgi:hypothetical protein
MRGARRELTIVEKIDFLFRKVDGGLDIRPQVEQLIGEIGDDGGKRPDSDRSAAAAACRVPLSIRSEIASAWARSSLSFRNARFENSPGWASRAPAASAVSTIDATMTGPPCA